MKKENINNYFPHDSNARNSEKLIRLRMRHKAAGYGVFFMILERLREEPEYMSVKDYNMIAFDLREDASIIKSVIEDFGLFVFTEDGKYFYSESFKRRMEIKDEKLKRRSEAGKKGMANRWTDNNVITNNKTDDNNVITNDDEFITRKEKESKGKNNKEKDNKLSSPLTPQGEGGGDFLSSNLSKKDGIPRNFEGLSNYLKRLGISDSEQDQIYKLSNFGAIGNPVWPLVQQCINSIGKSTFDKSRIKMPGRYIISKLKEEPQP